MIAAITGNKEFFRKFGFVSITGLFMALFLIEPSYAQSLGGVESVLTNVQEALTGSMAKVIAIIAVVLIGFAWMFGYLDLRKAMYCVLGVAIVFGAPQIVDMLSA